MCPLSERIFDDTIFQRMKTDNHNSRANRHIPVNNTKKRLQTFQFLVYGNFLRPETPAWQDAPLILPRGTTLSTTRQLTGGSDTLFFFPQELSPWQPGATTALPHISSMLPPTLAHCDRCINSRAVMPSD